MKLAVKTLQKGGAKNETFDVNVEAGETIQQVKEKIEGMKPEFEAASAKLICAGRVLVNEKTVGESSLKEGDFLVIIPGKKKEAAAESAAPAPTSNSTPSAAPPAPVPAADNSAAPIAAQTATNNRDYDAAITQLTEMGFPRDQCEAALQAAFGNADRAVEYLFSGIPAVPEQQMAPPPMMGGGEAPPGDSNPAADDSANNNAQGFHGAAFPSMEGAGAGGGGQAPAAPAGGGNLAALRNDPMFAQLRQMIQQNPAMLQPIMAQLAQSNPQVLQLISQNQQEFMQMLGEPVEGGAAGGEGGMPGMPGGMAIPQMPAGGGGVSLPSLTPEDEAAVGRLMELANTSREMALQAYFACEKNEEHAANFLFENADF